MGTKNVQKLYYRSFFESQWVEIQAPLKENLLINVSYCSNKNLSKFFLDELTSEMSGAYSITDHVIIFGDFNKLFQSQRKKVIDRICCQQRA